MQKVKGQSEPGTECPIASGVVFPVYWERLWTLHWWCALIELLLKKTEKKIQNRYTFTLGYVTTCQSSSLKTHTQMLPVKAHYVRMAHNNIIPLVQVFLCVRSCHCCREIFCSKSQINVYKLGWIQTRSIVITMCLHYSTSMTILLMDYRLFHYHWWPGTTPAHLLFCQAHCCKHLNAISCPLISCGPMKKAFADFSYESPFPMVQLWRFTNTAFWCCVW